ncbi:hypothetical protein [Sphingomonas bacterium]|uniref:hypothetical protein n=1 Tax=Sphingomonas bacterium TaxID=1895847 RepID=UPI0015757A23|nr:hypothetical protein [Sphingomonas bacterium]
MTSLLFNNLLIVVAVTAIVIISYLLAVLWHQVIRDDRTSEQTETAFFEFLRELMARHERDSAKPTS